MAKLTDSFGNPLHPRENFKGAGVLGAVNAQVVIDCAGCSTVTVDMRDTFNLTWTIEGTVDETNWQTIAVRPINQAALIYAAFVAGSVLGTWVGVCAGYMRVRVRCSAFTSGSAVATIVASNALLDNAMDAGATPLTATAVGAAGAAVTLTIASPGVGLRHYLTYLSVIRFAAAALTPAAAPVTITSTNLGTLAFSRGAEALAQGVADIWREDFSFPLAAAAQNTATTIVCPITTNVIWRVTAGYRLAP